MKRLDVALALIARRLMNAALCCCAAALGLRRGANRGLAPRTRTLTAVPGIKVGHFTLAERPTGCTVILVDGDGAPAASSQRGGAPGTRETDLLNPLNMVDKVNAVVLSGGSAFGLDAATGTSKLARGTQHRLGRARRQGADRAGGDPVRSAGRRQREESVPTADCGYKAAAGGDDRAGAEGHASAPAPARPSARSADRARR